MKRKKPNFHFKKLRTFMFREKEYKIVWRKKPFRGGHRAECDSPESSPKREIRISPTAYKTDKELLIVLIDEIFHSHFFDIENAAVDMFSDELGEFLSLVGFHCDKKVDTLPKKV